MGIVGEFSGETIKKIAYRKHIDQYKITINEAEINKVSDLIGKFQSIVLSPEDTDIVSGGNSARLTYINKILSVSSKEYLKTLAQYNKIIKIRNKCLAGNKDYSQIVVWDEQLSPLALKIWEHRARFFNQFNKEFQLLWGKITPSEKSMVQYKHPSGQNKKKLVSTLLKRLEKDRQRGQTGAGPHKDTVNFFLGDIDIKNQASQGEKKFFLVVLKITEAKYIHQKTNQRPVLLLDDLFARLDRSRGKKILQLIENKYQTFITTTDSSVESYFDGFEKINFIKLKKDEQLCSVA